MIPITLICMIIGLITGYILAGCYLFVFKFHNEKLFGLFVNDITEVNTTIDFSMIGLLVGMSTSNFFLYISLYFFIFLQ
ncbi:putative membrane protein [Acanthamoeba castellanii mamavirus]|nr:putative membrane protein [Acanthamoeba castellanii mamavirus]